jgi:hypothetical protein
MGNSNLIISLIIINIDNNILKARELNSQWITVLYVKVNV